MSGPLFDLPPAADGGASLLGRLGIRNEFVAWYLRTSPEALGMTPRELDAYARKTPPLCQRREWGQPRCNQPMKIRGLDWVCYHHEPPVRVRDLPKPVYAEGRIEDHLGDVVDAVYEDGAWQTKASKF